MDTNQIQIFDHNGTKIWRLNGKLHREDGAAVERADGGKAWYLNGKLHRTGAPAVEHADGSKEWCLNGKSHREDGAAIEWADGSKSWWLKGVLYETPEAWACAVLHQRQSAATVEAFLRQIFKKDADMSF